LHGLAHEIADEPSFSGSITRDLVGVLLDHGVHPRIEFSGILDL